MDIHNMKCSERRYYTDINAEIIRVPGGWIYKFKEVDRMAKHAVVMDTIFVPWSEEFAPVRTDKKPIQLTSKAKEKEAAGAHAFRLGKLINDCPYPAQSSERILWLYGYSEAEKKAKEELNKGETKA